MKSITYLYFVEDQAHRLFLERLLELLPNHMSLALSFSKPHNHEEIYFLKKKHNNSALKSTYIDIAKQALYDHGADLFIVGLDLESSQGEEKYKKDLNELQDHKNFASFREKSIVYISVQCIEHWMWYLKHHKENPDNNKSMNFESRERKDAKTAIYGSPKVSNETAVPLINTLLESIDIDYLEQQSYSFRRFYFNLKAFLKPLK